MALFRRNVTGSDVLSLWQHIDDQGPVGRQTLIERFYPGSATDPDESNQRKTLNDAIDFLCETDQLTENDVGFSLTERAQAADSPRTALLQGIRSREGEDAAYNDVLDVLTEDDRIYFDRGDALEDLLSDRRSEVTWNPTRLNYWRRMMETIGVVRDLNTDTDEEYTTMLTVDQDLLSSLLRSVAEVNEPRQLQAVLTDIHDGFLPVYSGTNRTDVASYFQRALRRAQRRELIAVHQESDFGPTVELGEAGVNAITYTVTGPT